MSDKPQGGRNPGKDRRDELVAIAYRHIAEKGFEGLRVHQVAGEAGINNATLHYYFATKEDLIRGVVDKLLRDFQTPYGEARGGQGVGVIEELQAEFEDARLRLNTDPELFVVFCELLIRSRRDAAISRVFSRLDENWHGYLVSLIERGKAGHIFRLDVDPPVAATAIMATIKGFGFQRLGDRNLDRINLAFSQIANQVEIWLVGGV